MLKANVLLCDKSMVPTLDLLIAFFGCVSGLFLMDV